MLTFRNACSFLRRTAQTLALRVPLALALALALAGPARAGVDANGYPSFQEGEELATPTSLANGVRLVCEGHIVPRDWGRPVARERHGRFEIQSWQTTGAAGAWRDVGTLLTQYKDHPVQVDRFGTHLRISFIEVKEDFRRKGIATQALSIMMAHFGPARFATYKTEISDLNAPSRSLFTNLGFTKAGQVNGMFDDVTTYVLANPDYQAPAGAQDEKTEQERCAACGKTGELKRCGRCRTVHYCGPACQKQHWKTHKPDCKAAPEADRAAAARAAKSDR